MFQHFKIIFCLFVFYLFFQASLWSEEVTLMSQGADNAKKQISTSMPPARESNLQRTKTMVKTKNNTHGKFTRRLLFWLETFY